MKITELTSYINELLTINEIQDYCPNGLQVQGKSEINTIVTGVTASKALIDKAIELNADALLVHHGYFWKNEAPTITGIKYQRIKALLDHQINLLAYHLPLDVHATLGNNAQLGKLLGLSSIQSLVGAKPEGIIQTATLSTPTSGEQFAQTVSQQLARSCLHITSNSNQPIKRVAWCTGGGQGYIEQAYQAGCDAFISGEISEQTTHLARELDIHYFAAGHHATERYGIKALGEHLANQFGLNVQFVDIDNPA